MLSRPKLALLQVAKVRLKLTEESYRAILENFGGSHSARDLDDQGFDAVMDRFRDLGFTSAARERAYGRRDGMASPGQISAIRKLWREYAQDATEAQLNTFLERQAKVSSLRFLPASKAGAVLTALKAMVARRGDNHAA